MQQSSAEAARILQAHGSTACTDVTGFGLVGHLVEMTRPSQACLPAVTSLLHPAAASLAFAGAVAPLLHA